MNSKKFLCFIIITCFISCFYNNFENNRPNIIIIMADDLGYGDLSIYNNKTIQTPNIDILGKNGLLLTDFHSNGTVCSPTRAALLTGKYQHRVGVKGVITTKKSPSYWSSFGGKNFCRNCKRSWL